MAGYADTITAEAEQIEKDLKAVRDAKRALILKVGNTSDVTVVDTRNDISGNAGQQRMAQLDTEEMALLKRRDELPANDFHEVALGHDVVGNDLLEQ